MCTCRKLCIISDMERTVQTLLEQSAAEYGNAELNLQSLVSFRNTVIIGSHWLYDGQHFCDRFRSAI